jgi:predicted dinucleotide-binding enzyme
VIVGVLHPGEMGAAIGDALHAGGHDVIWAFEGRSEATRARAAGLRDVATLESEWRWTGEMEEIADAFAGAGAPEGFHRAAAEVYRS